VEILEFVFFLTLDNVFLPSCPIKLVHLLTSDSNQLTYTFTGHGYLKMVSGSIKKQKTVSE